MPIQEEQTSHSQHAVPQNIMSVEFKLVGNLTVRQFVYLVIGGISSYLAFTSHLPFIWKWFFIAILGLGSLALSFIPLGDRGLDQWIKNFIKSISNPTQMVWRKSLETPQRFLSDYANLVKSEVVTLSPTKSRKALTKYLEDIGNKAKSALDEKEEAFLGKINYSPQIPNAIQSTTVIVEPEKPKEVQKYVPQVKEQKPGLPEEEEGEPKFEPVKEVKKRIEKEVQIYKSPYISQSALEVGRTLKHIPLKGEIILPKRSTYIRAEKVVMERESPLHDKDLLRKAEELREALRKAKEKLSPEGAVLPAQELFINPKGQSAPTASVKPETEKTYEDKRKLNNLIETLKKENKDLLEQIKDLSDYKNRVSDYEEKIAELNERQRSLEKAIHQKEELKREPNKDFHKQELRKQVAQDILKSTVIAPKETTQRTEYEERPTAPNMISGSVKDLGGHLIEGATLIIRDGNNDPVRALKTNKLGQFSTTTPLLNGGYKIEVLSSTYSFDIIRLVINGNVVKPINFQAKGKK